MRNTRQNKPVSALDVAAYILGNHTNNAPINAWKMHQLVYYCQAWTLVFDERPLFFETIMASNKGIVINELCPQHNSQLYVGGSSIGNLNHLSLRQIETIAYVIKKYGHLTMTELTKLTCESAPWKLARANAKNEKDSVEITTSSIHEFFMHQKK
jgi:uncharacterized phage-associated protein